MNKTIKFDAEDSGRLSFEDSLDDYRMEGEAIDWTLEPLRAAGVDADLVDAVQQDRAVADARVGEADAALLNALQNEQWVAMQGLHDLARVRMIDGDRLRGVFAHRLALIGQAHPGGAAPGLQLIAPSGRIWARGDAGSAARIEGTARDFCLAAAGLRAPEDTDLVVRGEAAERWLVSARDVNPPVSPAWDRVSGAIIEPLLPHYPTIPAMLHYLRERYRDLPQLIDHGRAFDFAEMEARSADIARGMLARGAPKGARIGIWMPNGADWLAAAMAVQRVGGVAVLLSSFARGAELVKIVRHADLHWLLMARDANGHDLVTTLEAAFPELSDGKGNAPLFLPDAPFLREVHIWPDGPVPGWATGDSGGLTRVGQTVNPALLEAAQAQIVPADPAVIIYTSGSTSAPKAVVHSHGNLVRQSFRISAYTAFQRGDRIVTTSPLVWVGGLVTSLLMANYQGAAMICPERVDSRAMVDCAIRDGATQVMLWPAQHAALVAEPRYVELAPRLRPLLAQQLGMFGLANAERTPNSLGMTETLGPHCMEYFGSPLPENRAGSFGRPVGRIEHAVIDPESGTPLPRGAHGEIALRGGHMMLGMHRMEREEIFTRDGWYRTGDLGWMSEDGHLFFEARKGDMVKSSGANISPREVELQMGALPGVQEAIVFGLPDPLMGEMLVAVVVATGDVTLDEGTMRAALRANLSSYKVPKRIFILPFADIPRTASAKVQRAELRRMMSGKMERP
ncbi:MAG: AMP-binding protein [Sphingobium sp.]